MSEQHEKGEFNRRNPWIAWVIIVGLLAVGTVAGVVYWTNFS